MSRAGPASNLHHPMQRDEKEGGRNGWEVDAIWKGDFNSGRN